MMHELKLKVIKTMIYKFRQSDREYKTDREKAVAADVLLDSILAVGEVLSEEELTFLKIE